MIEKIVQENTPVLLAENDLSIARLLLKNYPNQPFYIKNNQLIFDSYIVGELRLKDLLIKIEPRNAALNLNNIFQITTYLSAQNINPEFDIPEYGSSMSGGMGSIVKKFTESVINLLQYGLTGLIENNQSYSKNIKGRLTFKMFHPLEVALKGVNVISSLHSPNTSTNQIIKSAIQKLLIIELDNASRSELTALLRDFDNIDSYAGDIGTISTLVENYQSSNPHYPLVIEYSLIILKNLKIGYRNGKLDSYAFLVNSNDVFEKYVLKILKKELGRKVEKLLQPQKYAVIRSSDGREGNKSFSPDILVEYDIDNKKCLAVFDTKNKDFNPELNNLSEIVSSQDIYQLIFYCMTLNTKLGGLIYPSLSDQSPLELMVSTDKDLKLFLISINMNRSFKDQVSKLIQEINKLLIYA